jgi:hypothetical protein
MSFSDATFAGGARFSYNTAEVGDLNLTAA